MNFNNLELSEKDIDEVIETVKVYHENDGEECSEEFILEIKADLRDREYDDLPWVVWDALGCDDADLREKNPKLEQLYIYLTKAKYSNN